MRDPKDIKNPTKSQTRAPWDPQNPSVYPSPAGGEGGRWKTGTLERRIDKRRYPQIHLPRTASLDTAFIINNAMVAMTPQVWYAWLNFWMKWKIWVLRNATNTWNPGPGWRSFFHKRVERFYLLIREDGGGINNDPPADREDCPRSDRRDNVAPYRTVAQTPALNIVETTSHGTLNNSNGLFLSMLGCLTNSWENKNMNHKDNRRAISKYNSLLQLYPVKNKSVLIIF